MMKREAFEIARIYVPVKRRPTLEPAKVAALAQDIMAEGHSTAPHPAFSLCSKADLSPRSGER